MLSQKPANNLAAIKENIDLQAAVPLPTVRRAIDLRSTRRYLAVVPLLAGPLLIGALRAIVPLGKTTEETVAAVRSHPDAQQAVVLLGVIGGIAMILAVLSVTRLVSRRAPVLGAVGGVVALVGWAMVPMLNASDALLGEVAKQNIATDSALYDAYFSNPGVNLMFSIFITGHIVGMLILGVAMFRARITPAWAGLAVVAGTILHPLAFVGLGNHFLDGVSYVIVAAGFAAAAAAIWRSTDAQWDVAPEPRS